MSEMTPERLDAIEAQLVREAQFFGTFDSQVSMSREDVLAMCKAMRAAWKIIGSCERCGSHYEIDPARYCPTCKTWEHYEPDVWPSKTARPANASADAQEPGGDR